MQKISTLFLQTSSFSKSDLKKFKDARATAMRGIIFHGQAETRFWVRALGLEEKIARGDPVQTALNFNNGGVRGKPDPLNHPLL
jgi:hypothetical protein